MLRAAALALCVLPAAGAEPRLLYTKSFPGSVPEYVAIQIERDGKAEYKDSPDEERPLRFQLPASDVNAIFSLVEKLGRFHRSLEAPVKVAFLGMKTFRLEDGAEKNEVKFNYSEDPDAKRLADWFERISETEQLYLTLERAIKYDKLGVNRAVLQLEAAVDRKRVVAPGQMLPLLDRVSKNEGFVNIARQRAATLAEVIRATQP